MIVKNQKTWIIVNDPAKMYFEFQQQKASTESRKILISTVENIKAATIQ